MQDKRWGELGTRLGDALVDQTKTGSRLQDTRHPVSNHRQEVPTRSHAQNQDPLSSPIVKAALAVGALYIGAKALSEFLQSEPNLNEVEEQILASR